MNTKHIKTIIDGHEMDIPAHLIPAALEPTEYIYVANKLHKSLLEYFNAHEAWTQLCGDIATTPAQMIAAEERAIKASNAAREAVAKHLTSKPQPPKTKKSLEDHVRSVGAA